LIQNIKKELSDELDPQFFQRFIVPPVNVNAMLAWA
jgi:hypothetical protein